MARIRFENTEVKQSKALHGSGVVHKIFCHKKQNNDFIF